MIKEGISKFGFFRIGAASPELKVADVKYNVYKIIECIEDSKKNKCHLLLFPELSVTGYSCADLFFQKILLDEVMVALNNLAIKTKDSGVSIIVGAPLKTDGRLFNTAVLISNGEIICVVPKTYLCNSNEYYEERWFSQEADRQSNTIEVNGKQIPFGTDILIKDKNSSALFGIEICEDLWAIHSPSFSHASRGANILLNLSASDEYLGKSQYRDNLVLSQSARCLSAYIYASSGPGESSTDLTFSGKCMITENGMILQESDRFRFESQIIYSDIDLEKLESERIKNNSFSASRTDKYYRIIETEIKHCNDDKLKRKIAMTPFIPADNSERSAVCREIFEIQSTALAKRIRHLNLEHIVIGLSGGLDSSLALIVAYHSFKKLGLNVKGIISVTMPGFGTTKRTKSNAEKLAEKLEVTLKTIDIKKSVRQHFLDIGHNIIDTDIVYENAQARERTQILMDIANQVQGMVIGTGDLSEMALGWSTYNGDHMSMYGVNSGVPKTLVKYLIEWCANELFSGELRKVLTDICNTPISPELLPFDEKGDIIQKTEEKLGPYILHDFFLYYFLRFGFTPQKIHYLAGISFENIYSSLEINKWLNLFISRFFSQQFKRSCIPDGAKVGTVSLSPRGDWRMPSDAESTLWKLLF